MLKRISIIMFTFMAACAERAPSPQAGASSPQPGVVALVHDPGGNGATARRFEMGREGGTALLHISSPRPGIASLSSEVEFSPDGRWFVNYQGKYGRIDPSAAAPTIEGTETLGQGMFSPDGKVFAYTTWGQLPDENTGWVFNTLELETGKTASFKGVFVSGAGAGGKPAPLPELGMYGIPIPIGWAAAAHPIVTGIVPFSDIASLGSVYILDLDKSGNGRLARARLLGQGLPESSRPVFSPDGKKFAYFSSDPARVTNCLAGLNEPDNTVTIMDVAGGRLTVAAAPQGQCIGRSSLIWTADGKALTTTGSEDLDAARAGSAGVSMVSERLFFVDSVSGVASQGAELLAGRRGRIGELLACGSTLYFTVLHYEGKAFATTIVAALMNNPSEQTVVAELNSLASLESCIP